MPRRRTNNANSRVRRERRLAEQQQQQQQRLAMAEPTAEAIHPMSEANQLALAVAPYLTDVAPTFLQDEQLAQAKAASEVQPSPAAKIAEEFDAEITSACAISLQGEANATTATTPLPIACGRDNTAAIQAIPSMIINSNDAEPALPVIPSTGASSTAAPPAEQDVSELPIAGEDKAASDAPPMPVPSSSALPSGIPIAGEDKVASDAPPMPLPSSSGLPSVVKSTEAPQAVVSAAGDFADA